jgi:hypothetical protein
VQVARFVDERGLVLKAHGFGFLRHLSVSLSEKHSLACIRMRWPVSCRYRHAGRGRDLFSLFWIWQQRLQEFRRFDYPLLWDLDDAPLARMALDEVATDLEATQPLAADVDQIAIAAQISVVEDLNLVATVQEPIELRLCQ